MGQQEPSSRWRHNRRPVCPRHGHARRRPVDIHGHPDVAARRGRGGRHRCARRAGARRPAAPRSRPGQLEPSPIPRGQNLTARSLEHFYFWDCADELRAARLLPPEFPIGGITAYRSLASEYWYAPAGRETVAEFYYQRNERLPQYLTESVLRGRVAKLSPVTTLFGWSVAALRQDDDAVRVTAVRHPGAAHLEI